MLIKVSETTPLQLDYLVAIAQGAKKQLESGGVAWYMGSCFLGYVRSYSPTTDWEQGGIIIDTAGIGFLPSAGHRGDQAQAFIYSPSQHDLTFADACEYVCYGETILIAAMRCFVSSTMGYEVEIPDELK